MDFRKRRRSDESPPRAIQRKMYINERIVDKNNDQRMQQVYAKTLKKLFNAARAKNQNMAAAETKSTPLWTQYTLYGDGRFNFRSDAFPEDLNLNRSIANCCTGRESYIRDKCSNCTLDLCEECGSSCLDCGNFLCRCCVVVFESGTANRPICEKCKPFN